MPTVPTGRVERRIAKVQAIELLHEGESAAEKVEGITENVSPQGARLITSFVCPPGKMVRVVAPGEHLKLPALVVYCQRLPDGKFAVGLQLHARVEKWHDSS